MHSPTKVIQRQPIYCKSPNDIPKEKHWAIIFGETLMTPGYDPGDPPDRVNITQYHAYTDQTAWETEIKRLAISKDSSRSWQALTVDVPVITTTVSVEIK